MSKVSADQAVEKVKQLIAQGQFRQASQITTQLIGAFPKNPLILHMHAMTLSRRGLFEQSITVMTTLKGLLTTDSDQYKSTMISIAQSQTMLGDLDSAVQTLRDTQAQAGAGPMNQPIAAELVERYIDLNEPEKAEQVLAECKITTELPEGTSSALACAWARSAKGSVPLDDIIAQLTIIADGPNNSAALSFVLGRLLEKAERYDEAFERYTQANAFNPPSYQRERANKRAEHVRRTFSAKMLNSTNRPEHDSGLIRPILIVGMPRSGTTLTEQILGAHPQIGSAGESQALPEIARSLTNHPSDQLAQQLQSSYLEELKSSASANYNPSQTFITDKNLMNLFLIGLAHAIVPDAIIIYVERDPRDVCFSCFNSPLANDHNYKFNLTDCAHFAVSARQTIAHFKTIIQSDPRTTWIDLSYEELTQNPESTIAKLFDALRLEPHPDCFDFHNSARSVRTISRDQVREPMHTKSIARWENFAHLPEVKAMLESLRGDGLID